MSGFVFMSPRAVGMIVHEEVAIVARDAAGDLLHHVGVHGVQSISDVAATAYAALAPRVLDAVYESFVAQSIAP